MSNEPLPVSSYQARSLQLLELLVGPALAGRAAMLVLTTHHRDGTRSQGVATEVEFCREHGIPVVGSIRELHDLRRAAL